MRPNMKTLGLYITLLAAAALSAGVPEFSREDNAMRVTSTDSFEAGHSPYQLEITDVIADVKIRGISGSQVRCTETMVVKTRSETEARNVYEKFHLGLEETRYGHALNNTRFKKLKADVRVYVEYDIEIPVESSIAGKIFSGDLDLEKLQGQLVFATYSGDINATGLTGSINFSTAGGDIQADNLEGNIKLYSAGGDIRIETSRGRTEIETAGGDIDVDELAGNLTVTTMGGDIDIRRLSSDDSHIKTYGGDIKLRDCQVVMSLETAGGDISADGIRGTLSGETNAGLIECSNVEGNLKLETAGGDISVDEVGGSIDLESVQGDIRVRKYYSENLKDHSIKLHASNGDITLDIPVQPEFSLEAKAEGFGVEISSDFPLNIKKKDNRNVVASYNENGKGYIVDLSSSEGDISINKRSEK